MNYTSKNKFVQLNFSTKYRIKCIPIIINIIKDNTLAKNTV